MNAVLRFAAMVRALSVALASELEQLVTRLNAWAGVEHRGDGTHLFPWDTTPYVASDYTASGAMTWTVTAPQVSTSRSRPIDTGLEWQLVISASVVAGAASNLLSVRLPRNARGSLYAQGGSYAYIDNGVAGTGFWRVLPSSTTLDLLTSLAGGNWAAAGTTTIALSIQFEVT